MQDYQLDGQGRGVDMRLNRGKMTCIQNTMGDLGVSMTFRQVNVLLGIAKNQGYHMSEIAREIGETPRSIQQVIARLGDGGDWRNGYKIKGLKLVQKVKGRSPHTKKNARYMYLTPKGLKFIKRITKNKR